MAQPAFHHARVAALAGEMTEATEAMRRRWREHARGGGGVLDVADEFMALTRRVAGRTLLSIDLGGEADRIGPAFTALMKFTEARISIPLPLPMAVPTPMNLRARRALRLVDSVIAGILARRRAGPGDDAG